MTDKEIEDLTAIITDKIGGLLAERREPPTAEQYRKMGQALLDWGNRMAESAEEL